MMRWPDSVAECLGLQVRLAEDGGMGITVEPGTLRLKDGGEIRYAGQRRFEIKPAGIRNLSRQAYRIEGEGEVSPCHWNGENRRGSGGSPYQRMVPGTLQVRSADHDMLYEAGRDYVFDYYWGTIKRHPRGRIPVGADVSLDYAVYLCRYDAVIAGRDGSVYVLEGLPEAPESKELLLPEPPAAPEDGYVLAHVFAGWGLTRLYDGQSRLMSVGTAADRDSPVLSGRYADMTPRKYLVKAEAVAARNGSMSIHVRTAATGEDYGPGGELTEASLRWTEPAVYPVNRPVPLLIRTAYGHDADWGLELDFSRCSLQAGEQYACEISAEPAMLFDLRNRLRNPQSIIPVDQAEKAERFRAKLASASGQPLRLVFYGESTTHAGKWPYQVAAGLRKQYPQHVFLTTNAAVPGENGMQGYTRLRDEVLNPPPDLVFVEYMINDSFSGEHAEVGQSLRRIIQDIRAAGSDCVLVTGNGMNPQFAANGAARVFRSFNELYRRIAREENAVFIGAYAYFANLHVFGKYFITELKGNMVNHPYGNVDPDWAPFDREIGTAILRALGIE